MNTSQVSVVDSVLPGSLATTNKKVVMKPLTSEEIYKPTIDKVETTELTPEDTEIWEPIFDGSQVPETPYSSEEVVQQIATNYDPQYHAYILHLYLYIV